MSFGDVVGVVFWWSVTFYVLWRAKEGIKADLRRVRGRLRRGVLPRRRGRYASRGGM